MTMTETPTDAVKPAKKPAKKRARAKAKTPAPKPDGIYTGLSAVNCPSTCNATRCVISGVGICSHPYKGGLQSALQNPDSIRRLNEAKRIISKRKLDIATD